MRALTVALIAGFVSAGHSCHYDHHHHDEFVDDAHVEIHGDAGTKFDAFFEDDEQVQTVTGQVPFDADFEDQVGFFQAIVDKTESGTAEICLDLRVSGDTRSICTTEPFGRVSLSFSF